MVEKVNTKKYFMKIQFTSNDNFPLNKPLKFHEMTIIIDVFLKKMEIIIQNSFKWMFVWVIRMLQYEIIGISK